ncbi:MAG: hypothetical protein J7K21_04580 [Desulfurococcales archaeon]|nr:hypothetical protein [Desulfurococcales archaeon]
MPLSLEERERFRFYRLCLKERKRIISIIKDILNNYDNIELAVIHGSFLRKETFRDIDIAIYISGEHDPLFYRITLGNMLEERIGYPIDINILNSAPPQVIIEILKEGEVIVEKKQGLSTLFFKKALEEKTMLDRRKYC